jgi:prepilin-type N-terminal cleavage/methylation domain-containing protein
MGEMRKLQTEVGAIKSIPGEGGFTLVELMVAIMILAIGMLGSIALIVMGMQTNSRSKTDTVATVLDQEIIERFSTLKQYPQPTFVTIYDCALTGANAHKANLGQGPSPTGSGATLYTTSTALTTAQVGDVDWSQAAPALATATTQGYAMEYQTCSGDIYEVRWNVMNLTPATPPAGSSGRLSLLTVSARPTTAVLATAAGAQNRAVVYAFPVTLRSLIED